MNETTFTCVICGHDSWTSSVQGSCLVLQCNNCGAKVVGTHVEPIREDMTRYHISLAEGNEATPAALRTVSRLAGTNYLGAKRLLQRPEGDLARGLAPEVRDVARRLADAGVSYVIDPPFPWEV